MLRISKLKFCALVTATLCSVALTGAKPARAAETEQQHREWMRKVQGSGGTMSVVVDSGLISTRREADVRQLLRCQIVQAQGEPLPAPIDGCGPEPI